MKPLFHHFVACTLLLFGFFSSGEAIGYDVPSFDSEVFHPDGVFLEESERQSLLEALAAVASNFPGNNRIDSDLKEKALAIALRINPLHRNSRDAHDKLVAGRLPVKTQFFASISSVSEALWGTGQLLLKEPVDPDEQTLASLLMELSLVMHPEPPMDRMREFATVYSDEVNDWNRMIATQRDNNPSSVRSANLIHEIKDIIKQMESAPKPKQKIAEAPGNSNPDNGEKQKSKGKAKGKKDRPAMPDQPDVFRAQVRSISTVRTVVAVDSSPVAGLFRVELRSLAGPAEEELLPFTTGGSAADYPSIPVLPSAQDVPIRAPSLPMSIADGLGWDWAPGTIAEVSFEPGDRGTLPGPRRVSSAGGVLPTLILLDSIFADEELNQEVVVAGELDEETMFPVMSGSILGTIEAAIELDKPYLLLPGNIVPDLVKELQLSGDLSKLFALELVSYATLDEAIAFSTGTMDPAVVSAVESFAEVKAVSNKMPLVQFARNPSVQERLETIVEACPNHLSSRAMLEFGKTPVSDEMKILQSVRSIDTWVEPYLSLSADADLNELRNRFEDDEYGLSRLRTEVHPDVRDYFDKVEDLLEVAEKYLNLTNFDTSIGQQRLREVEALIDEVEDQRSQLLGVDEVD